MKKLRCTIFNFLGILLVHLICNLTFKFFNNNKWRKYLACTHIRSIPDKGFDPEQIMLKDLLSPWKRKEFYFHSIFPISFFYDPASKSIILKFSLASLLCHFYLLYMMYHILSDFWCIPSSKILFACPLEDLKFENMI